MVGRETLRVVGKVLYRISGFGKTEGMEVRMAESSGNRIIRRHSSRKNSKKGFTLVELIVVLVILTIIAAVAIPAMLGFTDNAREKQYIAEAKEALAASQSMLSDAYTDSMVYLPKRVREEALKTSGLDAATAFTIWTVENFDKADGTYNSISSYTVATAIYKTTSGDYVYYDGSKWTVSDSAKGIAGLTYDEDKNEISSYSGNYIAVWPNGSGTFADNDTASTGREIAQGGGSGEGPETTPDEEEKIDDNGGDVEEEETPYTPPSAYSVTVVFNGVDNAVKINGLTSFTTTYEDGTGYVTAPNASVETNYDDATLAWTNAGTPYDSISAITSYLASNVSSLDGQTVTFDASIDQKYIDVPVTFLAYDPTHMNVSVSASGATDKNGDDVNDTVILKYGLASKTMASVDVADSVSASTKTGLSDKIKFDNKWAVDEGSNGVYLKDGEGNYDRRTLSDSEISDLVGAWVTDALTNPTTTYDDIEASGVTFKAPADIYKTVYVRGLLKSDDSFVGDVTFGADSESAKNVFMFNKSFAKNELTKEIYDVNGSNAKDKKVEFTGSSAYSIFTDNNKNIFVNDVDLSTAAKKLKYWHIYESGKTYTAGDDITEDENYKNREKDCSEIIIDKLYDDSYTGYGEVAEIDVTELTTRLLKTANDTSDTPLVGKFSYLAGGNVANIKTITFLEGDDRPSYSSVVRERSLSTTTIVETGEKLKKDTAGEYVKDTIDDDYPGYTVAYSVKDIVDTSKYNIYVFTEDNSNMKAEGSLQRLHNGSKNMVTNTFVSHIDISKVTNMSYMFKGCNNLGNITISGDAQELTNTSFMFQTCENMTSIDLSNFKTSDKLSNTERMFDGVINVISLDISGLNTKYATKMDSMFRSCTSLTKIGTGTEPAEVHIDRASSISEMFYKCHALQSVVLTGSNADSKADGAVASTINGNSIARPNNIFFECNALSNITIKDLKFSNLSGENMSSFFADTNVKSALEKVVIDNVSAPSVTSFAKMFGGDETAATNLTEVSITNSYFPEVTSMTKMFKKCQRISTAGIDFEGTDFSACTNTSYMFAECIGLVGKLDFELLDTKTVKDMNNMFNGCTGLTSVVDMHVDQSSNLQSMFSGCSNITSVILTGSNEDSSLETAVASTVTNNNLSNIFNECSSLTDITLKDLRFSALNSTGFNNFFSGVKSNLQRVTVKNVAAPSVTSFEKTFQNCTALVLADFTDYDFTSVNNLSCMFEGCTALTYEPGTSEGSATGISGVVPACATGVNCAYMFKNCDSFDKVNGFNITYVKTFYNMFENCDNLSEVILTGSGMASSDTACLIDNNSNFGSMFLNSGATVEGVKTLKVTLKDANLSNVYSNPNATASGNALKENGFYKLCVNGLKSYATEIVFENISVPNLYTMESSFTASGNQLKKVSFINVDAPKLQRLREFMKDSKGLEEVVFSGFNTPILWNWNAVFRDCTNLKTIDLGNVGEEGEISTNSHNTSTSIGQTDFNETFRGCTNLTTIKGLDKFDTSNAKDMKYMFYDCRSLVELDLSSFDTTKVADFKFMFGTTGTSSLTTIYVTEDFVVNNETTEMFGDGLTSLEGGKGTLFTDIKTSDSGNYKKSKYAWIDGRDDKVGYLTYKVKKYAKLKQMGDNWVNSFGFGKNITVLTGFQRCTDKATYEAVASSAKDIADASYTDPESGERIPVYGWIDSDNVFNWYSEATKVYINENTSHMFNFYYSGKSNPNNLTWVDMQGLDTSLMKSFERFFSAATELERIIDNSNGGADYAFTCTSDCKSMISMFDSCNYLGSVDLSRCDTSSVEKMNNMFMDCASMRRIDLSAFSSENLKEFSYVFRMRDNKNIVRDGVTYKVSEASLLEEIVFGPNFTCSKVIDMQYAFSNCKKLTSVDLSKFDASKNDANSLKTENMFNGCSNLATIYASDPASCEGRAFFANVSGYTSRINAGNSMFASCNKLVGGNGSTLSNSGNNTGFTNARIDKDDQKGYFTEK